jgi:hypothetical protein
MSGDIHVVPHDNEWAIAFEGTGTRARYQSPETAIAVAARLAKQTKAELLIHGRDGQISECDSFGRSSL